MAIQTIKRNTVFYKAVRSLAPRVLETNMLVIDPSCGSESSMPGWAVYIKGWLYDSGTIALPLGAELHLRYQELMKEIQKLVDKFNTTLLAVEDIPALRYGRRFATPQKSLTGAQAVVMAAAMADHCIALRPSTWKKHVSKQYKKSDEGDAIEMGRIVCDLARHVMETHPPKVRKTA